jgi:zinc/manganese transport system substrate-binding protein
MLLRTVLALVGLAVSSLMPAMAADAPLKVVVSFSVLADMTRQIGGALVSVTSIVGPGEDAHGFQPTPRDAKTLASAELAIQNGFGFDPWMTALARSSGYKGKMITAASDVTLRKVMSSHAYAHGHSHGKPGSANDPHAWNSMIQAQRYARTIGAALQAVRPADQAVLAANLEAYVKRLAELDAFAKAEIAKLPPSRRKAVTGHDAFGYLAGDYGFTFLAPVGVTTEAAASAGDVAKLIRQIKAEKIPAVFLEIGIESRLAQQIARDSGARIGGTLYSDSLSPPDGPAATLEQMFRHNIMTLVSAMAE